MGTVEQQNQPQDPLAMLVESGAAKWVEEPPVNDTANMRRETERLAAVAHVLSRSWRVAGPEALNDTAIVTDDGIEVVGSSEWLRAEKEVLMHIVALHNEESTA